MKKLTMAAVTTALLGALGCPPIVDPVPPGGEGEGDVDATDPPIVDPVPPGGEGEGDVDATDGTVVLVKASIDNFIGRAVANNIYNGWFSNASLDGNVLSNCLVHQVSTVLGVPNARYSGAADVAGLNNLYDPTAADVACRSMASIHSTLQIPSTAYDALVGDVVLAVTAEITDETTRTSVLTALTAAFNADFKALIVDPTQDDPVTNSAYNFIGGKPSVLTVLNGADCDGRPGENEVAPCFVASVLADPSLAPFFADAVARDGGARLVSCLQRQISGDIAGGPDDYGNANGLVETALVDAGVVSNCLTMLQAHTGLGISDANFEALDAHAATALTLLLQSPEPGTKAADIIGAVVNALIAPEICADIVEQDDEATACAEFHPDSDPDAP